MDRTGQGAPPPHFIVFIPGYMGSRLRSRSTGELVWLDLSSLLSEPLDVAHRLQATFDRMKYPNDDLVPDGIVDQILFLPPLFKQEQYSRLLKTLTSWGYAVSGQTPQTDQPVVYPFAYDWRQDNRVTARQLSQAIAGWKKQHPEAQVWILAHSNGGIVARWYIEKEGGKEVVDRLFLLASPWDGAPKSLQVLQQGYDIFMLDVFNQFKIKEIVREAVLTFPSFYQLLPAHLPFIRNKLGQVFDFFSDKRWLDNDEQRKLLDDARAFNQELGTDLSVETLCFFGVQQPTTSRGTVQLSAEGKFQEIEWEQSEDGDGTVPVHSARHLKAAQNLPYTASHGDLYVYPPLLEKLKYETINRYRYGQLAAAATSRLKARLETDRDAYAPGDAIRITASISLLESNLPVYEAKIEACLAFREALIPGKSGQKPAEAGQTIRLLERSHQPGVYEGCLSAPGAPGYYTLKTRIWTRLEPPIELSDLLLIEPVS